MRRLLGHLLRSLLPIALLLTVASATSADAASRAAFTATVPRLVELGHHCSVSGDVCYGAFRRGSVYTLRLTLTAKYLPEYHLCLTGPKGLTVCRAYPVRKSGSEYGSTVRLSDFPSSAPGVYYASWRSGWTVATRLGPALRFSKK